MCHSAVVNRTYIRMMWFRSALATASGLKRPDPVFARPRCAYSARPPQPAKRRPQRLARRLSAELSARDGLRRVASTSPRDGGMETPAVRLGDWPGVVPAAHTAGPSSESREARQTPVEAAARTPPLPPPIPAAGRLLDTGNRRAGPARRLAA
jgi:hypothetical protein